MAKRLFETNKLWLGIFLGLAGPVLHIGEGHTGTYGSVDKTYDGFAVRIDTSVGSMSDHSAEGPAYAQATRAAQAYLKRHHASLEQLGRHYRSGQHPYMRLRSFVASAEKDAERSVQLELNLPSPIPSPLGGTSAGGLPPMPTVSDPVESRAVLLVFAKRRLSHPWQQKLAADLALSQLFSGGIFAADIKSDYTRRTPSEAEEFLGALISLTLSELPENKILRMVAAARANGRHLKTLVAAAQPLPIENRWAQRAAIEGWMLAQALDAVIKLMPYGPAVWNGLSRLEGSEIPRAAKLLVLLLPDEQWDHGLAAVRTHVQPKPDSELARWFDALAQPLIQ